MKEYTKKKLNDIAYPIGGIGTGNFALCGNGLFMGPDFRAKPNNENYCGNCFVVKAEKDGDVVDWRVLCGDNEKDLTGSVYGAYGWGDSVPYAGFKHFRECIFSAKFPFAHILFSDEDFPGAVNLRCYNPFIPSNEKDSGIPTGIFKITLKNTTKDKLKYTVAFIISALDGNKGRHVFERKNDLSYFTIFNQYGVRSKKHEEIIALTDNDDTHCQHYLKRSSGFYDRKTTFMNDFSASGAIKDRVYEDDDFYDGGILTASVEVEPNESKDINFYFCWYVSHFTPDWEEKKKTLRFGYARYFRSAKQVADYCFIHRKRLEKETKLFSDALFSSDLPEVVLNAINRNLCILKSSTFITLYDGSLWGWEGQGKNAGLCWGNCQHVYNYQYAIPLLFPRLAKGMRDNDMRYCLENGELLHCRLPITKDRYNGDKGVVDATMGSVFNCYREWLLSGDTEWLKDKWHDIKKIIEYTWSDKNKERWDTDKSGVITGSQFNTLDIEIFGANSWLTGMYHLALRCGAKMAEAVGDVSAAEEYMRIYKKGKKLLDERTFNGEYYVQDVDIGSCEVLKPFFSAPEDSNFWDKENQQIKYQIADGCGIDQVLAGWHADLLDVHDVFVKEHRKSALNAIYKYNFLSMRKHNNPCRVFALDDEKGTVMVSFPKGKPAIPIPYSEECMTGFEYAVAENMLQCGMEDKALELTQAIDERYDGEKRNPFAEVECGVSYARAMSCYGYLPIYSGFKFNLPNRELGFIPLKAGRYFWSVQDAWGTVETEDNSVKFKVLYGKLLLKTFITHIEKVDSVTLSGVALNFMQVGNKVVFSDAITIVKKGVLTLRKY